MLEASELNESQQLMIMTSIGNVRDFDKIAEALCSPYPVTRSHILGLHRRRDFLSRSAFHDQFRMDHRLCRVVCSSM